MEKNTINTHKENLNVTGEFLADQLRANKQIVLFIIAFSIIIILAGMFYVGAAHSCRNSNGELLGGLNLLKLKCNNIDVIGVCTFGDRLLIPDNRFLNNSLKINTWE